MYFDDSLSLDQTNENLQQEDSFPIGESKMLREQDRFLPIANISRIMKNSVPSNGKIGKEAKETVQESVSEFISFITSEASDRCLAEKRKTLNGDDIIAAMEILGFDNYIEPLKIFLQKYRKFMKVDKEDKASSEQEDDDK